MVKRLLALAQEGAEPEAVTSAMDVDARVALPLSLPSTEYLLLVCLSLLHGIRVLCVCCHMNMPEAFVHAVIYYLRSQRMELVSNIEQYRFIYKVLRDFIKEELEAAKQAS